MCAACARPPQPTPAAALPHGDFTRRRQEGVRPENQQVRSFPYTSPDLALALGCGERGRDGSSPVDPWGAEPWGAFGRAPSPLADCSGGRPAATLGATASPLLAPGSYNSRVRSCSERFSVGVYIDDAGYGLMSFGREMSALASSVLFEQAPSLPAVLHAGGGAED